MNRSLRMFFLLFLICTFSFTGYSQSGEEKDLFDRGVQAYKQGNFQEAQQHFLSLWQDYPKGRLVTGTRLMLAKAYYKLGDTERVERLVLSFIQKYPQSAYLDDIHFLFGNTLFQSKEYSRAVEEWLWVIQNSKDPRLKRNAGEYVLNTMDHYLTNQQIQGLQNRYQDNEFNGLATIVSARKLMESGDTGRGESMLRSFLRDQPNHFYADEAERMLGSSTVQSSQKTGFVYLKPAGGPEKEIADKLEQGIRYAALEYEQRNNGERVDLTTIEVPSSVSSAVLSSYKEISRRNPLCVIGPMDTDQAAAMALMSRYEKYNYIIPLSSQSGMTELSPYAFQINPDVDTKGKFLGNFAVKSSNLKRIAVLAPVSDYGEGFVKSFRDEVIANEGEIVTIQWYYKNTEDFTSQFRAIWREGVYLSYKDSLLGAEPDLDDDEVQARYVFWKDEKFKPRRPGLRVDSTDVPSTGLDGLLIIVDDPQFIQYMSLQMAFNNIKTQLLGNEGWNDAEQLRKHKDKLEGLVYVTPGYYSENTENYRLFMNRFRNEMKATPEGFHLLGYDLMKWVLGNYRPSISAEAFRDNLENTREYQGIMTNIDFLGTARVNSNLAVLKLNYGQILRLK